eukprot:scaffold105319_cov58-Phaeocystis_antarctica.AAC.3
MPTSSSRSRAASRRPSPPTARSSKGDTCGSTVSPVPLPAQSALARSGPCTPLPPATPHRSRSPPACSGLPSGPESTARAAWVPKRGRGGAIVRVPSRLSRRLGPCRCRCRLVGAQHAGHEVQRLPGQLALQRAG